MIFSECRFAEIPLHINLLGEKNQNKSNITIYYYSGKIVSYKLHSETIRSQFRKDNAIVNLIVVVWQPGFQGDKQV